MLGFRNDIRLLLTLLLLCVGVHAIGDAKGGGRGVISGGGESMAFAVTSSAFTHQGEIPKPYTCDGRDVSPPLAWSGVPEGTQSLALIVDDPDAPDPAAPKMTWVHWVLYNIAPTAGGLPRLSPQRVYPREPKRG